MALLARDAILAAQDLAHEDVEVPEWGGTVRCRVLTAAQFAALEASFASPELLAAVKARGMGVLNEKMRERMLALSCVDEAGAVLFAPEDVPALGAKSIVALDRVYQVVRRLNAMGEEDLAQLGKIFAAMLGGDSASSSPSASAAP